jgi:hypothetical protein
MTRHDRSIGSRMGIDRGCAQSGSPGVAMRDIAEARPNADAGVPRAGVRRSWIEGGDTA